MNARTASRLRWSAFAASAALLAFLFTLRWRGLPIVWEPGDAWRALQAERAGLAGATDEHLRALERERDALRTPRTADESLAAGWERTVDQVSGTITYRHDGTAPLTWPQLAAAVAAIERASGGRIVSLDVRSRGSRDRRQIGTVVIAVAGAMETTRRQTGATFRGAAAPARLRTVGRGSSLRRPFASAHSRRASASVPASVPPRPDPPGHAVVPSIAQSNPPS
jgi:hypothetical protein